MADVITQFLKHRDQASGLKAHRIQLADRSPLEPVAGLGAAIEIAVCQFGRPGEAVVEADFVPEGAVTVDVFHDERQPPGRELVPKLFGELARQGELSRLPETDPAARQEPVPKPVNGAQQDLPVVDDDRCHPEIERPPRARSRRYRARSSRHPLCLPRPAPHRPTALDSSIRTCVFRDL
jgi:hypothetical protein